MCICLSYQGHVVRLFGKGFNSQRELCMYCILDILDYIAFFGKMKNVSKIVIRLSILSCGLASCILVQFLLQLKPLQAVLLAPTP